MSARVPAPLSAPATAVTASVPIWRRRPVWIAAAVGILLVLVLTTPWWGRDLAFFRVRHVEVRGTRFAPPSDIAAGLRIDTMFSIWNALDSLRTRAEGHPQVRQARVVRKLPGTLVVIVDENLPIAFVPTATGLKAYDETGRLLPLDPSRVAVDLPIVARADTTILRLLGDLKAQLPDVFARVSEVRRVNRDELRIQFIDVPVRAMADVSVDRFLELSSVKADLERRRLHPVELDLRFKDQVIARLP